MLMHVLPPVTYYPAMVVHLYFCNMYTECAKNALERAARVRVCNYVNSKLVGIYR